MTRTVVELFEEQVHRSSVRPALRYYRDGAWEQASWKEWWDRSERLAAGLLDGGVDPGEAIALVMSTRMEWGIADMGIAMTRGSCLALDAGLDADELVRALAENQVRTAILEGPMQVAVLSGRAQDLPELRRLIVVEEDALVQTAGVGRSLLRMESLTLPKRWEVLTVEAVTATGRHRLTAEPRFVANRRREIQSEDVAAILYTAGVTAPARGVRLSHKNLAAQLKSLAAMQLFTSEDVQLIFLPLSNMFGRVLYLAAVGYGMTSAFGRGYHRLLEDLAEVQPTLLASVPQVYESLREDLVRRVERRGPRSRLLPLALRVGRTVSRRVQGDDPVGLILAMEHRLFSRLLLEDVRQRLGGRMRFLISAGAPLNPETAQFFFSTGVLILEGYGLTETAGAVTFNLPDDFRFGSVGKALPRVEVAIDERGEVLIRGETVMVGFVSDEVSGEGQPVVDEDGWFHTGDRGRFDREGFLFLDGRVKES